MNTEWQFRRKFDYSRSFLRSQNDELSKLVQDLDQSEDLLPKVENQRKFGERDLRWFCKES